MRFCKTSVNKDGSPATYMPGAAEKFYQNSSGTKTDFSANLWGNPWTGGDLDDSITLAGDITANRKEDGTGGTIRAATRILFPYPDTDSTPRDLAPLIYSMALKLDTLDQGTSGGSTDVLMFDGFVNNVKTETVTGFFIALGIYYDTARRYFLRKVNVPGNLETGSAGYEAYVEADLTLYQETMEDGSRVPLSFRLFVNMQDPCGYVWNGTTLTPISVSFTEYHSKVDPLTSSVGLLDYNVGQIYIMLTELEEKVDIEIAQEIQNRQIEDMALQGMINAYHDTLQGNIDRVDRVEAESLETLREFYRLNDTATGSPKAVFIDGKEIGVVKVFRTGFFSRPLMVYLESMRQIDPDGTVGSSTGKTLYRYVTYYEQGRGTLEGWSEWFQSTIMGL